MNARQLHQRARPCPDKGCECLLWQGSVSKKGYGTVSVNGRSRMVHRVAYELEVGPIPPGLTIDHVRKRGCNHKHCINTAHMEPVTIGENVRRAAPYGREHKPCDPHRWDHLPIPPPSPEMYVAMQVLDRIVSRTTP